MPTARLLTEPIISPKPISALTPGVSTEVSLPKSGIENGDLLIATNNADLPIEIEYDRKKYLLSPHKPTRIPFEAACIWFGDPRTGENAAVIKHDNGINDWIADRATEVRRLRLKYGHLIGDERTLDPEIIPDITLETMEGENIPTVLQYPQGVPTMVTPGLTEIEALKIQLLRQENTMLHLKAALAKQGYDMETLPESALKEDLPTDDDEE